MWLYTSPSTKVQLREEPTQTCWLSLPLLSLRTSLHLHSHSHPSSPLHSQSFLPFPCSPHSSTAHMLGFFIPGSSWAAMVLGLPWLLGSQGSCFFPTGIFFLILKQNIVDFLFHKNFQTFGFSKNLTFFTELEMYLLANFYCNLYIWGRRGRWNMGFLWWGSQILPRSCEDLKERIIIGFLQ